MKSFKEFSEACWKGYEQIGMKKKGGRKVPNCVPIKEDAPANAVGVAPSNVAGTTGDPPVSRKIQKIKVSDPTKLVRKIVTKV